MALAGASLLGGAGCSAARMLKTPIADECATTGLHGCPEIAEGMLLYVEGDKPGAIEKLAAGGARNSPEQVKQFADALAALRQVPGAEPYLAMIDEAVAVLTEHAGTEVKPEATSATVVSSGSEPGTSSSQLRRGILTADTDPTRVIGGVAALDHDEHWASWCDELAESRAACGSVEFGPAYLTDLVSLGRDCAGQFVAVVPVDEPPRYVLEGPFRMHGARLFVRPGEVLIVGQRTPAAPPAEESSPQSPHETAPLEASMAKGTTPRQSKPPGDSSGWTDTEVVLEETDPRYQCKLLWSGFKPYTSGTRPGTRGSSKTRL